MAKPTGIDEREVARLVSFYREAVEELKVRARQRLLKDPKRLTAEAQRARLLIREATETLRRLDANNAAWIAENVPRAYLRGVSAANDKLRYTREGLSTSNTALHEETITALVSDMDDVLRDATARMGRGYKTLLRRMQVSSTMDKTITKEIALDVTTGKTLREASAAIAEKLIAEFGDGPIRIGARTFSAEQYATLVARTKGAEAHSMGTMTRLAESGQDLVVVDAHGAEDACGIYEGKVYSISGTSDKYPPVRDLPNGGPPFHPNCTHVLLPYIEELAGKQEQKKAEEPTPKWATKKDYAAVEREHRARMVAKGK